MARIQDDPFTANHIAPKHTPGMLFDGTDAYGFPAKFRYVQFLDAVTYAKGHIVNPANAAGTAVTNDRSGGSAVSATITWGVACNVMTQNYYGYIQVSGKAVVLTDGDVAAGDPLVSHTADGACDTMADGEEEQVFGVALAADSATAGIAWLTGCPC